MMAGYSPTVGDLAFRDAHAQGDLNPFEEAELIRDISDTYLAVLLSANTGDSSKGTFAMFQAEMTRRGGLAAKNANRLAGWSLAVSTISGIIAVIALFAR